MFNNTNGTCRDVVTSMLSRHMGDSVVMLLGSELTNLGITLADTAFRLSILTKHVFHARICYLGDE